MNIYKRIFVPQINTIITQASTEVDEILSDPIWAIKHCGLRRGDMLNVESFTEEIETEELNEYRFGYTGQKVQRQVRRKEIIVSTEVYKVYTGKKARFEKVS